MTDTAHGRSRRWIALLFFLSGAAALIYQLAWQRLLVFYTGSDTVSISLIVTAFMSGMGLGYLFGGKLADRNRPLHNIGLFVLAEAGIMLFAWCSKAILYDGLNALLPAIGSPVVLYALLFGVLLFPTFLMGVSLPLLSKSFRFEDIGVQARFIGSLYFVNTLGAASGAIITGVFLVRLIGYEHTIQVGAVLSGLCALGALILARRNRDGNQKNTTATALRPEPMVFSKPLLAWSAQYALSGFAALSLELIWFRVLGSLIKSIALTFSILLTIYLGCMAMGTLAGTWLAKRHTRDQVMRWFLLAQYFLYLYCGVAFVLFIALLGQWAPLDPLWDYFRSYEPDLTPRMLLSTHVIIPLFLMGPPTFLMGMSFALSQAVLQDRYEEVGRKVGWLQFVNIVGSAVGACWLSWFGFDLFGTAVLLKSIVLIGIVYIGVLHFQQRRALLRSGILLVMLVGVVLALPGNAGFWLRLNGMDDPGKFFYDENGSGLSIVKQLERDGELMGVVFANGLGQSRMPYRIDPAHIGLGALPVLLHSNPLDVAVVGMGSAGTLYGTACHPGTRSITCFEIMSNQPGVLRSYAEQVKDSAVLRILNDARLRTITNDGRYELKVGADRYDIIEADALRPNSAFSGNIYSVEYFQLVRERLKPGGWAVSWCPTPRVLSSFCSVFPYVAYSDGFLLIGSDTPIVLDWGLADTRMLNPNTRTHFELAGITIAANLAPFRTTLNVITPREHRSEGINTDLFPKDEFQLPYSDELLRRKLGFQ